MTPRTLPNDDSIQDGIGTEWQEGRDLARAMKRSIADAVTVKNSAGPIRSRPRQHDISSQDSHPLLAGQLEQISDLVDSEDDVVPESPEQRRSSPPVEGERVSWENW